MRSSLIRRIEEIDGEIAQQGDPKYLKIDKNPDRYARRAISRYATRLRSSRPRPLTRDGAATRIQKWWKSMGQYLNVINNTENTGTKGNIRSKGKDILCPITQDTIKIGGGFRIVLENRSVVMYTLEDLVNYISSTGVFQCCLTRQPIYLPTIRRLQKSANDKGLENGVGIISKYFARSQIRRDRIEHDNRILAIEASCAAVMSDMLETAANHDSGAARASYSLLEFSREWLELINTYLRLDPTSCLAMLIGDKERIRRLRGTAHGDPYYLLSSLDHDIVSTSLNTCQRLVDSRVGRPSLPESNRVTRPPPSSLEPLTMSGLPSLTNSIAGSSRWPVYSPRTGVFGSRMGRRPNFTTTADSIIGATTESNSRQWRSLGNGGRMATGGLSWHIDSNGAITTRPSVRTDDEMSISSNSSQSLGSILGDTRNLE